MRTLSGFLVLVCLIFLAFEEEAADAEPSLDVRDVEQVRYVFHINDFDERVEKQRQQLIRAGEKAFPTYEAILLDPKATPQEVAGVFDVIRFVKADRRRFLKHAISRLTHDHRGLRDCAVILLERIGTTAEASSIVALLSDEYKSVVYDAAKTLAAIGGPNEVVAMDVWLRGVTYRNDAQLRQHVKKCRDELKKRLDEVRAKDPSK